MAYRCDICGKAKQFGHNVSFSQRKTNRVWKPNLQVKRLRIGDQKTKLKICTACLKIIKRSNVRQPEVSSQVAKNPVTES